jgi:CelD/BcsL family acetyltransferase involved in cellulose biosynthesis
MTSGNTGRMTAASLSSGFRSVRPDVITYAPVSSSKGAAPQMELHILRTLDAIDGIAGSWRALEARCTQGVTYFQCFDWCRNWVAVVSSGASVIEPHVVTVTTDGHLVAIIPLMISRATGGVKVLSALGEPHTQYTSMLADPELYTSGANQLLSDYLKHADGFDVLAFELVPQVSCLGQVVGAASKVAGYNNKSHHLDLTLFASSHDYRGSFGGKKKRNRNNRRKQLEKHFGALSLRAIWPGDPEFIQLVQTCVDMKKVWLTETGRISLGFSIPRYADFLTTLSGDVQAREGAVALVLEAGGKTVAIEISMIRHGHIYAYIGGFDWNLRGLSPGKVQMEATVCWAIDNGLKAYDLLGNITEYKHSWSNKTFGLDAYRRSRTARGWLYINVWLKAAKPVLKRIFQALPTRARKIVAS